MFNRNSTPCLNIYKSLKEFLDFMIVSEKCFLFNNNIPSYKKYSYEIANRKTLQKLSKNP